MTAADVAALPPEVQTAAGLLAAVVLTVFAAWLEAWG